ncbi:histidine kinase [Flavobacterium sp. SM15]|uniref:sensor histidine kinase n=1 Tax=Flavobacterium sp. SM15 TaxID=2908005 RepID=UPI001EDA7643|nr:histidine kinase [Flavobacterium sp. SM15]MCG2612567.1 histidine kinase [Flavobacterium sp. SM15]
MDDALLFQRELLEAIIYTFSAFVLMAMVLLLFFYFSRKKIIRQEIEKKNLEINHQKKLLEAVILTQEEERKRIAQDLHDDISSKLNIISLNTHLLKSEGLTFEEQSEISTNIINFTKRTLDNSRRIAHDLLPPVLEKFGLDAGIQELCMEFGSSKAINVNYQNHLDFDKINSNYHLHVFRILQELMNNSLKHGKAKNINIVFKKINDSKVCEYCDDGIGFDLNDDKNKKGLGMKNIESRVSVINGDFKMHSAVNEGVRVVIKLK